MSRILVPDNYEQIESKTDLNAVLYLILLKFDSLEDIKTNSINCKTSSGKMNNG